MQGLCTLSSFRASSHSIASSGEVCSTRSCFRSNGNRRVAETNALQCLTAPMLWGPLSDRYGRRPVYLTCLTILLGSCVGLALCPEDKFWLLVRGSPTSVGETVELGRLTLTPFCADCPTSPPSGWLCEHDCSCCWCHWRHCDSRREASHALAR